MSFLVFIFEAVIISLSGVMVPGPITAVSIGKGNESPHAGALIGIIGGVFLLFFSVKFIIDTIRLII